MPRAAEIVLSCRAHLQDGRSVDLSNAVLSYSDQHTIEGIPTYSMSLAPTLRTGERVLELLSPGDLVEVQLYAYDGVVGPWGEGAPTTTMIGVVQSLGLNEQLGGGSFGRVVTMTGSSLGGFLMGEAINYFLAYGTLEGYFKALGLTPLDAISFTRLDAALAAYVEHVAFNALRVERPQGSIRDLLGFAIKTVDGIGLFDFMWANYSGSLWEFLQAYGEQPLHEVYQTILPATRKFELEGRVHVPGRTFGPDLAMPVLVVRPAPFPHGLDGGVVDFSAWNNLPLHDVTESKRLDGTQRSQERSSSEVANVFAIYPKTLDLDETMQLTWAPPIINESKWRQWGYKPMTWPTFLWGQDAAKEDALEYFRVLNWRLAGQHNRRDEMWHETLSLPLAPHIRVGERVRLPVMLGDESTMFQFYVTGVQHRYASSAQRSTMLTLDRGLPEKVYQGGRWFTEGLAQYDPFRDAVLAVEAIREEDEGYRIQSHKLPV